MSGNASGVVTFLFTDIEGSTRRWDADADAMRSALADHDAALRQAINDLSGSLFKHTGDGVCAVFNSPKHAVEAAVAAQRELTLPVRMGIATGEAELRDGDYFGAVLNRAARVMAAGHGGQILLDGATAGLLTDVDLMPLGSRRLRDIAKPVEVFQIQADGLPNEFPPLKTDDPTPGNLHVPSTSLIGREAELAELQTVLKAHRLVTLTGVGGVGKTRLALELAARCATGYPDGVFVIQLAAITDSAAIPDAVASVLGIVQQQSKSMTESIAAALADRSRLLVFDNCEHVLDGAADMIGSIMAASTTVAVIATSREGLRLAEEQLWPVPSLDADSSAVTLFVERACGVAPGVATSDDEAISEICRRLDGMPLAIELAASRMVSMSAAEIRDRLDDRFRLLVGSRRALARHQTLLHAVQWSYDLLEEAEKGLLQRCSVLVGGFDVAGASAVAGLSDEYAALDLLESLVRKSLLVTYRGADRTRFSMLETIRQFAEQQLVAAGDAAAARNSHAHYFAGRESEVLTLWDGPRQRDAYAWFALELPNLRAAFRWAADRDDLDTAATIAFYAAFLGFWLEQYEPVGWTEELIEAARSVDHPRLAQLSTLAAACFITGRLDDAVEYISIAEQAIDSGRYAQIPPGFEAWFGGAYIALGEPHRWVDQCRRSLARRPDDNLNARAFMVLALNIVGRADEMRAAAVGLLDDADVTDNPQLACVALLAAGIAQRSVDPVAAQRILERGLTIAQETNNHMMWGHLTTTVSRLAATYGEPVDALGYLASAIRDFYDSGSFSLLYSPLAILTALFDRLGYHEPAATISGFATTAWTQSANQELAAAIDHLRSMLGERKFESLSRAGESMSTGAMVDYAVEQIDRARAHLTAAQQTRNPPKS